MSDITFFLQSSLKAMTNEKYIFNFIEYDFKRSNALPAFVENSLNILVFEYQDSQHIEELFSDYQSENRMNVFVMLWAYIPQNSAVLLLEEDFMHAQRYYKIKQKHSKRMGYMRTKRTEDIFEGDSIMPFLKDFYKKFRENFSSYGMENSTMSSNFTDSKVVKKQSVAKNNKQEQQQQKLQPWLLSREESMMQRSQQQNPSKLPDFVRKVYEQVIIDQDDSNNKIQQQSSLIYKKPSRWTRFKNYFSPKCVDSDSSVSTYQPNQTQSHMESTSASMKMAQTNSGIFPSDSIRNNKS